jgi:dephospho-CoA kinase
MKLIGITGNIASGKSTVSKIIANHIGCPLVSVDIFSKGYISAYPLLIAECFRPFGLKCSIDTIFENIKESFGHRPFREHLQGTVRAAFWRYMQYGAVERHPIIVVEHPLMFEVGDERQFSFVIGVTANDEVRLDRMNKRGYSLETIAERVHAQIPLENNLDKVNLLINTSQYPTNEDIIQQVQNSREFTEFLSETSIS